jgi:hypothetical protein
MEIQWPNHYWITDTDLHEKNRPLDLFVGKLICLIIHRKQGNHLTFRSRQIGTITNWFVAKKVNSFYVDETQGDMTNRIGLGEETDLLLFCPGSLKICNTSPKLISSLPLSKYSCETDKLIHAMTFWLARLKWYLPRAPLTRMTE